MQYIFPPRPKSKIRPAQLHFEEQRGIWLWQPKFDGDRCTVGIENGKVFLGNRHGKWHSSTKFPQIRRSILGLNLGKGTYRLDAELVGEVLVLFDILQHKDYLIGEDQLSRLSLLDEVCGHPTQPCLNGLALQISECLWLSSRGDTNFVQKFEEISGYRSEHQRGFLSDEAEIGKQVEGLLLRQKDSILDNYGATPYDVGWQLRCRCQHKNYRY